MSLSYPMFVPVPPLSYPTFVCPTFVPVPPLSNPTSVCPTFVLPSVCLSYVRLSYVRLSYVCPSTTRACTLKPNPWKVSWEPFDFLKSNSSMTSWNSKDCQHNMKSLFCQILWALIHPGALILWALIRPGALILFLDYYLHQKKENDYPSPLRQGRLRLMEWYRTHGL